jgi:hypothetical protein
MDRNLIRWLDLAVMLGSGLATPLMAQRPLHTVRGLVKDTEGAAVAGVEIILESPRRTTTTGSDGRFVLDSVPEGARRLMARRIGYLAVSPRITVPQAPGDELVLTMLAKPQELAAVVVEVERPGIYGVVGDTAYRALPGTLVEVLGARIADTTDSLGRFSFGELKKDRHYVLRVSRVGYMARLISVDLAVRGQEYSVFLSEYKRGSYDWANSVMAVGALADLSTRLAMEPKRTRMTRKELERYGTMAVCDIPRVRSIVGEDPNIIYRGNNWVRQANLCSFNAADIDLLEWGADPCRESWKSIAEVLGIYCGPQRQSSLYGNAPGKRKAYVVVWPRG